MATRLNTRFIENSAVTTDKIANGAVTSDKVDSSVAKSSDLSSGLSGKLDTSLKGAANGLAELDANGLLKISQVPPAALERLVVVADQTARFALTTSQAQNGDTVKQNDTGEMFFVKDDTKLDQAGGYEVYSAGSATSVPFSGITSKPTTLAGYGITDADPAGAAATAESNAKAYADSLAPNYDAAGAASTVQGNLTSHVNNTSNPHSVTKSQVGLGSVDDVKQLPHSYLDTDSSLAANSDSKVPSQKAAKSYVDSGLGSKVDKTITVNGQALSSNVSLSKSDVGLGNVDNVQQLPMSYLDTDNTLAANSDSKVASQKAAKSYVDTGLGGKVDKTITVNGQALSSNVSLSKSDVGLGNVTNDAQLKAADLDTDNTLSANSDSKIASQKAVKSFVESSIAAIPAPDLSGKVDKTTTVNGYALSSNVTLTKSDVGLGSVDNVQQLPMSYLDTDNTLAANSDAKVASQKAVKAYADTKVASSLVGAANGVASLDANGLVPVTQLPPAALERLVVVANQAARFALTTAQAQNGDTVKEMDTGSMFFVKDDSKLDQSGGYEAYTAGSASSVAWSGVSGTPTTLSGYGITDAVPSSRTVNSKALSSNISLDKSDIGLGNLDNVQQLPMSYLDTDAALTANSDSKVASQKAVKAYADGLVQDQISDGVTAKAPSQNAVYDALAGKQDKASGDVAPASFSLSNNQSSASNVTGLAFANGSVRSAQVQYNIFIDATSDLFEEGVLELLQKGSDWSIVRHAMGDDTGVEFSVTSGGQIQYTSGNVSGFSSGVIKFRAQAL